MMYDGRGQIRVRLGVRVSRLGVSVQILTDSSHSVVWIARLMK